MKTKFLLLLTLAISLVGYSQKNEIKAATKALKTGDAATAKSTLESISGSIDGADAKTQVAYYNLLGNSYNQLSEFGPAIEAYNKVISLEEASGKAKFTPEVKNKMAQMTGQLVNAAIDDNNNKKYGPASEKLYQAYTMSPTDTIYLYYAASSAVNGGPEHYDNAIKYYELLRELNYDGSTVEYSAVNVATGEVEKMDKTTRDLYVKAGTHKDPKEAKTPSKTAEIVKNSALIYQEQGKNDLALKAYDEAIANNPDDVNLMLNKANLYYSLGEKDKFKELMGQAAEKAPDNPDLFYNIGVINMEQGNLAEAREAYNKALKADPNYTNAYLNLSTSYVDEGNSLIDELNSLGSSAADAKKYDELKAKKDDLFSEGAQILEKALEINPGDESILAQLKNIYGALGDNENFMRLKKMLGE